MVAKSSVRISMELYESARLAAFEQGRTISSQIEYWVSIGKAALDNPDLPVEFIADALTSLAEPRDDAIVFVPRSRPGL